MLTSARLRLALGGARRRFLGASATKFAQPERTLAVFSDNAQMKRHRPESALQEPRKGFSSQSGDYGEARSARVHDWPSLSACSAPSSPTNDMDNYVYAGNEYHSEEDSSCPGPDIQAGTQGRRQPELVLLPDEPYLWEQEDESIAMLPLTVLQAGVVPSPRNVPVCRSWRSSGGGSVGSSDRYRESRSASPTGSAIILSASSSSRSSSSSEEVAAVASAASARSQLLDTDGVFAHFGRNLRRWSSFVEAVQPMPDDVLAGQLLKPLPGLQAALRDAEALLADIHPRTTSRANAMVAVATRGTALLPVGKPHGAPVKARCRMPELDVIAYGGLSTSACPEAREGAESRCKRSLPSFCHARLCACRAEASIGKRGCDTSTRRSKACRCKSH